jgi:hypothetical protein
MAGRVKSDLSSQSANALTEMSQRLKSILQRSAAIAEQLTTLETLRDCSVAATNTRSGPETVDRFVPFCENSAVCLPVPVSALTQHSQ